MKCPDCGSDDLKYLPEMALYGGVAICRSCYVYIMNELKALHWEVHRLSGDYFRAVKENKVVLSLCLWRAYQVRRKELINMEMGESAWLPYVAY
jgi:hypothetical protein